MWFSPMRPHRAAAHSGWRGGTHAVASDRQEPHMIRIPTTVGRWLATASVCTLIGAVAPSTAGASAAPPPVPAGYVALVDDTNHIAIMVPPTWTDIQTAPVDVATGTAPHISASPNIQSFIDTFDTPGVRYIAFPFTPDPNTLIAQYGLQSGCASI